MEWTPLSGETKWAPKAGISIEIQLLQLQDCICRLNWN